MPSLKRILPVALGILIMACNAPGLSSVITQTPAITQAVADTPTLSAGSGSSSAQADTATPAALASDTPAAAVTDTTAPEPTLDPSSATMAASMGAMGVLMGGTIDLYANPVGTPLKTWNNIPIMPQATAGQQYKPNLYSYNAAATLDQARQFYQAKAAALGFVMAPGTGFGGTGSHAYHSVDYVSFKLTIIITSHDDDPKNVNVVLTTAP